MVLSVNMSENKQIFAISLVFIIALYIFTSFTGWPEMTLWPFLINSGWQPYKDFAMVHSPLLIWSLVFYFRIFGLGLLSLKIFTWFTISYSAVCIYLAAKYLHINTGFTVLLYLLLIFVYGGNGLWFDLALAPMALLIYLLISQKHYFLSGVLFAAAVGIKQTAIYWFIPMAYQIISRPGIKIVNMVCIFTGLFLSLLVIILPLVISGDLTAAKTWVFDFGVLTLPGVLGQANNISVRQIIFFTGPYLLALIWLLIKKPGIAFWSFFAALGVLPRWDLFHFLPGIGFLCLGLVSITQKHPVSRLIICLICILLLTATLRSKIGKEDRFWEKSTVRIGLIVNRLTPPGKCIYIRNYWDNIYQISGRLPCTRPWYPFLPQYLQIPGVKEKITLDILSRKPSIIISYPYLNAGLGSIHIPVLDSFIEHQYKIIDNYQKVEILEKI